MLAHNCSIARELATNFVSEESRVSFDSSGCVQIQGVTFSTQCVRDVLSSRIEHVFQLLLVVRSAANTYAGIDSSTPSRSASKLLDSFPRSVRDLLQTVLQSEVEQLEQLSHAIGEMKGMDPSEEVLLLPECQGDPHANGGRVRGFQISETRYVFKPGNNLSLEVFSALAKEVHNRIGIPYHELEFTHCSTGLIVSYAEQTSRSFNEASLFSGGLLAGICEATKTLDIHNENMWNTATGLLVADAETTLSKTIRRKELLLSGQRVDIFDTPLCSSIFPLWMKQIPKGYGFNSGLLGQHLHNGCSEFRSGPKLRKSLHGSIVNGYRAFVSLDSAKDICCDYMARLQGTMIRQANRPTAEYGAYLGLFIRDLVFGKPAEKLLWERLSENGCAPSVVEAEVQELSTLCIPRFESKVSNTCVLEIESRISRMKAQIEFNSSLIVASLRLSDLDDEQGIIHACGGDFDSALQYV